MNVIQADNLFKKIRAVTAISNVSLTIREGETFGFLGPNGAGKTTTIRLLTGLLMPDAGTVHIYGIDIHRYSLNAKMQMGVIPESSTVYDDLTGEQNLQLSGKMYGMPKALRNKRVDEVLTDLNLSEKRHTLVRILFFPAFLAMMLFFTASSVGPLITPLEKREKTYERLLPYPVRQDSIILGDIIAGAVFGFCINLLVWIVSTIFIQVPILNIGLFILPFTLGTIFCATQGVLLASPVSNSPPNVMIFSNLIRFPLIFISGIFIPLDLMQGPGLTLAYCSPLTFLVDLFNTAMATTSSISPVVNCGVLIGVSVVFIFITRVIQKRNLVKGL